MSSSQRIRVDDVRQMFRLMGEVAELPGDSGARKRHAIDGLCRLVGAKVGVAMSARDDGSGPQPYESFDSGWSDPGERAAMFDHVVADAITADPAVGPMVRVMVALGPREGAARRREDLVVDRDWYRSPHVNELRRPGGINHCVYCVYRHQHTAHLSSISIHRPWGDRRPFSARDRQIVELLWTGLGWMHHADEPQRDARRQLSPRESQVLGLLLTGDGAKQVAGKLGLSTFTVRDYIKSVYRHFGVSSRGELLARFLRR